MNGPHVYIQSEPGLYTVGFHAPGGSGPSRDWHPIDDYATKEEAERQVNYLNGGADTRLSLAAKALRAAWLKGGEYREELVALVELVKGDDE